MRNTLLGLLLSGGRINTKTRRELRITMKNHFRILRIFSALVVNQKKTNSKYPYICPKYFKPMTPQQISREEYIARINQVEKAAQQLKDYPRKSISDISFDCGYRSTALFSRTFKKHFGLSASEFRLMDKPLVVKDGVYYSKVGQPLSKKSKLFVAANEELCPVNIKQLIIMETKINIQEMPEMQVIFCHHRGEFNQIGQAHGKLMQFAGPRGLLNDPDAKTLTLYHDDPSVTAIEKVRQSACLVINKEVKPEGEIGKLTIPAGKFAVGHFEIDVTEFEQAWNTMCLWFTESGYEPGTGNPYELYLNDHTKHPERKFILDICIPVKTI